MFLWGGFPGSSAGKESACTAGDPGLIPGSGRSAREGKGYPLQYSWASLAAQLIKISVCKAGDLGSIPGLGRSPGEGKGLPHSSILAMENPTDCMAHGVTKSRTRLSNVQFFLFLWHASIIKKTLCKAYTKKQRRHPGFLQNPSVARQWKLSQHRFPKPHLRWMSEVGKQCSVRETCTICVR